MKVLFRNKFLCDVKIGTGYPCFKYQLVGLQFSYWSETLEASRSDPDIEIAIGPDLSLLKFRVQCVICDIVHDALHVME